MAMVTESAHEVPVIGEYDVVVCGGGAAGCAAAVASGRAGARTLLMEKDGYLGGATVSQLVVVILSTNGVDFQGIWHEYARALAERAGVRELECRRQGETHQQIRGGVDPELVKYVWPENRHEWMTVISRVLKVDPLDPFDMTRAEREGREQARQAADFCCRYVPGFENAYMLDTSAHIGIRSSRRLHGIATVTDDDAWSLRKVPDGIARSSWDLDVWPADSYSNPAVPRQEAKYQERMDKVVAGDWFDIPYGSLVAKGIDNVMMAGRCVSAGHKAEASLRIQQTCMATGQAAGTAAALSLQQNVTPRELDTAPLLAQLEKDRDIEPAFEFLKDMPVASG